MSASNSPGSAFVQAVAHNDINEVLRQLEASADVNARDARNFTPLMIAANRGLVEMTELLLDEDAVVNDIGGGGASAIMLAACEGHTQVLRMLLGSGGNTDVRGDDGSTALMLAARHGHLGCVRSLLEFRPAVSLRGQGDRSARDWAVLEGYEDIAAVLQAAETEEEQLASYQMSTTNDPAFHLHQAVTWNDLDEVRGCLATGVDVDSKDAYGFTPLMVASLYGYEDVAKELLESHADPNADQGCGTSVMMAASEGEDKTLELLLDYGGNTCLRSGSGATAVMKAARNGHVACVKLLLERGAAVGLRDDHDLSARDWAVRKGHHNIAGILAKAEEVEERKAREMMSISDPSEREFVAAVAKNNVEEVLRLLDSGANVDSRDNTNCTALMVAAMGGLVYMARELLQKGADVNDISECGASAVTHAATEGHCDMLQLLLDFGGHTCMRGGDGSTPLMWAARKGHLECVRLLIERRAWVTLRDRGDMTARDWAIEEGHNDIADMLSKAEADGDYD